ncbi:hypothetical protein H6F67_21210 [Microcoleus sp. FACHB-1515]|nr:hypothetical protein [Microcoleus sp. FACHB-1515]MBD2092372.1 hypothetical protein [Microcoleus sp. FACHB-1515]
MRSRWLCVQWRSPSGSSFHPAPNSKAPTRKVSQLHQLAIASVKFS